MGNVGNLQARYGFRPHFYQYAGIRYVVSPNDYHKSVVKIYPQEIGMHITEHYTDFTKHTELGR